MVKVTVRVQNFSLYSSRQYLQNCSTYCNQTCWVWLKVTSMFFSSCFVHSLLLCWASEPASWPTWCRVGWPMLFIPCVRYVAVFGSLDMSRANSMTNAGQCRLAPLILCILDSCQLYDYLVRSLFNLHSSKSESVCVAPHPHPPAWFCFSRSLRLISSTDLVICELLSSKHKINTQWS